MGCDFLFCSLFFVLCIFCSFFCSYHFNDLYRYCLTRLIVSCKIPPQKERKKERKKEINLFVVMVNKFPVVTLLPSLSDEIPEKTVESSIR